MAEKVEVELGYDLEEAIKRENLKVSDFKLLRNPSIPHCPENISDKQLALFLQACGQKVEVTRNVIQHYYEDRKNFPEFFKGRDPESPQVQQCLQNLDYLSLPKTPEGCPIIFHRLNNPKAGDYFFDEAVKTLFMTVDACLYKEGPRPGIIFLFDMKGCSMGHLLRPKIASIKKFFHYVQEAAPAKLHAIHVLNTVSFFDKILTLVKPFMKAEIMNLLHLHTSSLDMEKFYADHLPKSCLPKDFGGDLPTVDELHKAHTQELIKLRPYFLAEEKQRPVPDGNNNVIESKFKKLDID